MLVGLIWLLKSPEPLANPKSLRAQPPAGPYDHSVLVNITGGRGLTGVWSGRRSKGVTQNRMTLVNRLALPVQMRSGHVVDVDLVRQLVDRVWQDVQAQHQSEHHKVEIKSQWWDFTSKAGREEFAKDLSMMANTPGGDGYLIVGIDEKALTVVDSPIALTCRDAAGLDEIARNHVVPSVEWDLVNTVLEGSTVSVLVVAKSNRRPHIVDEYKQRKNCIFVRGTAGAKPASRWDLDDMYGDRSPQTERFVSVASHELVVTTTGGLSGFNIRAACWTGGSPLFITSGRLTLHSGEQQIIELRLRTANKQDLPMAQAPNEAQVLDLMFPIGKTDILAPYANQLLSYEIVLVLADGEGPTEQCLTGGLIYRR